MATAEMCDDVRWTGSNDRVVSHWKRRTMGRLCLMVSKPSLRELRVQSPRLYIYAEESRPRELTELERCSQVANWLRSCMESCRVSRVKRE